MIRRYTDDARFILLKGEKTINEQKPVAKNKTLCVGKINPATKPTNLSFKDYEKIISFLHKGAVAYSMGDYGTAINYFTRLLETEWLKNSSYFYLIKTLIKLDIEKEILSLRSPGQTNNIRMKKEYSTDDPQ